MLQNAHSCHIVIVVGTRPEIVKLAPVIRELGPSASFLHTCQHRDEQLSRVFLAGAHLPRWKACPASAGNRVTPRLEGWSRRLAACRRTARSYPMPVRGMERPANGSPICCEVSYARIEVARCPISHGHPAPARHRPHDCHRVLDVIEGQRVGPLARQAATAQASWRPDHIGPSLRVAECRSAARQLPSASPNRCERSATQPTPPLPGCRHLAGEPAERRRRGYRAGAAR
jgi:hypothetical protein